MVGNAFAKTKMNLKKGNMLRCKQKLRAASILSGKHPAVLDITTENATQQLSQEG